MIMLDARCAESFLDTFQGAEDSQNEKDLWFQQIVSTENYLETAGFSLLFGFCYFAALFLRQYFLKLLSWRVFEKSFPQPAHVEKRI